MQNERRIAFFGHFRNDNTHIYFERNSAVYGIIILQLECILSVCVTVCVDFESYYI